LGDLGLILNQADLDGSWYAISFSLLTADEFGETIKVAREAEHRRTGSDIGCCEALASTG